MTPERWERLAALWDRATVLPEPARGAFLAKVEDPSLRRELESLLAQAIDDSFLERTAAPEPAAEPDPWLGRQLGAYRIVETLGEGGMGRVYRGERTDEAFEKRVAIKVLRGRPEAAALRRFRTERRILASFEHPHIARLLDGGTTDEGVPYVVMELVEGKPLTTYCDSAGLDLRGRLRLFQQLCAAVHDAHRHLVVHRDLKPSNVLVTQAGELKLLDFGIAKLLAEKDGDETTLQARPMTRSYASPEQLSGQSITTASDVFSLGMLLFELLTGARARDFRGGAPLVTGSLPTVGPPAPSSVVSGAHARRLRGDLDIIVGKATREVPPDRYPSVQALAEDIARFLACQPLAARPPSLADRLHKQLRRHPVASSVSALATVAIVTLAVAAALMARQRGIERDEARQQRTRSEQVAVFLERMFEIADPGRGGAEDLRARDLLDRQSNQVREDFADRPELRGRFLNTLAKTYQGLGLYTEAQRDFQGAVAARAEGLGDSHPDVGESLSDLALLLIQIGDYNAAYEQLLRARSIQAQGSQGRDDPRLANTIERQGLVAMARGAFAEAEAEHHRALEMRQRLFGETDPRVGDSLLSLAQAVGLQGRHEEAMAMAETALAIAQKQVGPDQIAAANAWGVLGDQRGELGNARAAVDAYDQALRILRRRLSATHPDLGSLLNNRSRALRSLGDLEAAEASYREALGIVRVALGEDHPVVATAKTNLSHVLRQRGEFDQSLRLIDDAEAVFSRLPGSGHGGYAYALQARGLVYRDRGSLRSAIRMLSQALELLEARFGKDHPRVGSTIATLGQTLLELGNGTAAEILFGRVLAIREATGSDLQRLRASCDLGDALLSTGAVDEAESWYRRGLAVLPEDAGRHQVDRSRVLSKLAEALARQGRHGAAHTRADQALRSVHEVRASDHWQTAAVFLVAAAIKAEAGGGAQRTPQVLEAIEVIRDGRGRWSIQHREGLRRALRYFDARGDSPATRGTVAESLAAVVTHRRALLEADGEASTMVSEPG